MEAIGHKERILNKHLKQTIQQKILQQDLHKRKKRFRSAFTTKQIDRLEKEFKTRSYIDGANRKIISNEINMSERAIKIWFQNRRMKEKKDTVYTEYDAEDLRNYTTISNRQLINNNNNISLDNHHSHSKSLPNLNDSKHDSSNLINQQDLLNTEKYKLNFYKETLHTDTQTNIPKKVRTIPTNIYSPDNSSKLPEKYNINYIQPTNNVEDYQLKIPKSECFSQNISQASKSGIDYSNDLPNNKNHLVDNTHVNTEWKPVNMLPNIVTNNPNFQYNYPHGYFLAPQYNTFIKNCSCDCHKIPMMVPVPQSPQNTVHPQMQYIVTATPYQLPKF